LDFDPELVEIRRAATVVIVRDAPKLEVLLLRRNAGMVFAANKWVYPGGAVDAADESPSAHLHFKGLESAVTPLDLPFAEAAAHWVAAVRETIEEAGVTLTASPHRSWYDGENGSSWRDELNAGTATFADAAADTDTEFDASMIRYIGRFITPLGSPRRYDTRFFIAPMPDGQHPKPDRREAIDMDWLSPDEALDRATHGTLELVTPTIAILTRLAPYGTTAQAMAAANSSTAKHRLRLRAPGHGPGSIVFPSDHDYAEADDRAEDGYVRI